MKIVATKDISWPKLNFGMTAGEPVDAPENKEVLEVVLAHRCVSEYKEVTNKELKK